jgi:hypothetical protein
MPKRKDENETAFNALQEVLKRDAQRDGGILLESISAPEKVSYRVEAGRKGGRRGGPSRAKKLSPKQRKRIAKKAAQKRWSG